MPKTFLVWNKRDRVSCPVIVDEEAAVKYFGEFAKLNQIEVVN